MSFSRQPNPVWLFDDLVGNILDDNYYMSFLENTIPYLPQPVFQDDQGTIPWANPLQFHPDGTLPDNMYFEDGAVYRLEIRRGPTQFDPLIRLIENFVAEGGSNPTGISLPIDNQITNPQFAFLYFNSPYVIKNNGNNTYKIAPGWDLLLESTGDAVVTLTQVPIAGDENLPTDTPTNPSYSLSIEITSGTFTSIKLRQRFNHAPAIWASEGLSICFTGKMLNNSADISVSYIPSNGTPTIVVSDTLSSVYQFVAGGVQLPSSDSTDTGANGYVDIIFTLPILGTIFLTNIQAIGSPQAATYPYDQTTVERQRDQTFHNYYESAVRQAKNSMLAGWLFALNPYQFRAKASAPVASKTLYVADQTILHQETAGALQAGQGNQLVNFGLQLTAINGASAANRFAIIQYIDSSIINPYWGQYLSSLVKAALFSTVGTTTTKLKLRLIYRTTGDAIPAIGDNEPITGWDADGNVTFAAGWTAIAPLNDPEYILQNNQGASQLVISNFPNLPYEKFQLPVDPNGTSSLGIVMYITAPISNTTHPTEDAIVFDRVSLVPNDFAIDASTDTFDESLKKCQFYYEKSYDVETLPGVAGVTENNETSVIMAVGSSVIYGMDRPFKASKRAVPSMAWYSPQDGAASRVYDGTGAANLTVASTAGSGKNSTGFPQLTAPATDQHVIVGQWTADARLGI